MELVLERGKNRAVIHVFGSPNSENVWQLKKVLSDLYDTAIYRVILDLEKADHLDSTGLAALISHTERLRKKKGDLCLVGVKGEILNLLEMTFMTRHFKLFDSIDSALKAMTEESEPSSDG